MSMSEARKRWLKQQAEYAYGVNKSARRSKKPIVARIPVQGPLQPGTQFVQRKTGESYTRKVAQKDTPMYAEPIGPTIPENMQLIKTKKGKVYYRKKVKRGKQRTFYKEPIGPQLPSGAVAYKKKNGQTGYKKRVVSKKSGKSYWKYL